MRPHRVEVRWKRRLDASVTRHVENKSPVCENPFHNTQRAIMFSLPRRL